MGFFDDIRSIVGGIQEPLQGVADTVNEAKDSLSGPVSEAAQAKDEVTQFAEEQVDAVKKPFQEQ